jgi:hypothetical protein
MMRQAGVERLKPVPTFAVHALDLGQRPDSEVRIILRPHVYELWNRKDH